MINKISWFIICAKLIISLGISKLDIMSMNMLTSLNIKRRKANTLCVFGDLLSLFYIAYRYLMATWNAFFCLNSLSSHTSINCFSCSYYIIIRTQFNERCHFFSKSQLSSKNGSHSFKSKE